MVSKVSASVLGGTCSCLISVSALKRPVVLGSVASESVDLISGISDSVPGSVSEVSVDAGWVLRSAADV